MMRILFVTNNYTPYSGGVVSSIKATTEQLHKKGHDVLIASLDFLGSHYDDPEYVIRVNSPIRFFYKTNHMAVPWRPTYALKQLIKSCSPDVVHVHHPFLLGLSGLRAARSFDIPCVFTYHTLYQEYAHYVPLPGIIAQPLIQYSVDRFCLSVDGIIAPSSAIKESVRKQGVIAPVEVIPSALQSFFLSETSKIHKTDKGMFFELLIVSRFVKEKNIPFVLHLLKQLPDNVRLTLVGYGAEYEILKNLAFEILKLSPERVRFIHKPLQDDLITLYRSADLFVFSSQTDTQGIVMIEAMSQGVPVIALDGPGQRDIVRNGNNGFIVNDISHASVIIKTVMNSSALHKQLIAGAYATANNYSPDITAKKLLEFYSLVQS